MKHYFVGLFFGLTLTSGFVCAHQDDDWSADDGQVTTQNKEQSNKMEQAKELFNKCRQVTKDYAMPAFFAESFLAVFFNLQNNKTYEYLVGRPLTAAYCIFKIAPEAYEGGVVGGTWSVIRNIAKAVIVSIGGGLTGTVARDFATL